MKTMYLQSTKVNSIREREMKIVFGRCVTDPIDKTIVRKRTFECSHACVHKSDKAILEKDRRDRGSEMIGCPWHINMAFPKTAKGVRINSIVSEHNHLLNPLIIETAPKF
ncbi:hypothetical protein RirG_024600 [Rhizophagus irregularis DAOM 197198w]|uniref:FAR1 domain-containing protein n=1 Tax=Rhizophagus irregularis (strain DAOM 197198w) TaxID=1432141 RepID=A0A015KCP4_RHIIW|nr:hypothetical protein RirG_024600 [Rhizophagus irregularis DAOM 197198w]